MNISDAPGWVWSVVLLGIFGAVGVLVLSEFRSTLTEGAQTAVVDNGTAAIANITKQLPTLGIIVGVLLIVSAVVLIAMYFGKRSGYA